MARRNQEFQTVRSEGGLLPLDLLRRVLDPRSGLAGNAPEDYGLPPGERLNEAITQSWNRLHKHWAVFSEVADSLPDGTAGTHLTNDKWSLPLLRELGFGILPVTAGPELDGRTFPIGRFIGPVPIHLVGYGLSLDRRAAGQRGAASANPHGMVQEFLNRSGSHLWAIVSNGLSLRVLRDSQALSRQSYLEFDLKAMFSGEIYSDFVLLWLMVHATRFVPRDGDRPETCRLEQWTQEAERLGTRALGELRGGVERALAILGAGFTGHPKNEALREALRSGTLTPAGLHEQLLRVVYRLIFLFVAEDRTLDGRSLLHPLDYSEAARIARERYAEHYGTARLRRMAGSIKGSRHGDLWFQFRSLVAPLSGDPGAEAARRHLALPALGSFLWDPASTTALNDTELTNFDFLETLRHLAYTRQKKMLRPVDYHNLGAEELGGVYESLLALTPQVNGADGFSFAEFTGNRRKTSGSYYTPDPLVQCLLDSALDPVVEAAVGDKTGTEAERAILDLTVCDPAVGSGHFLVGAAHRLARRLARVRSYDSGETEPSPLFYQRALRDVIGRCLYGVDLNPMAAELCRVGLWLEALEPGRPLSFLDRHIRVGNSLLGTKPELIEAGIPDSAFEGMNGDDKRTCSALAKRNRIERDHGQRRIGFVMDSRVEYDSLATRGRMIDNAPDETLTDIQRKRTEFQRMQASVDFRRTRQVADAWCAAFVWPKRMGAIDPPTTETLRYLSETPNAFTPSQRDVMKRISARYQLFHWHVYFPEVFAAGGFDCVLGNPPWDQIQLDPREYFASSAPEISRPQKAHLRNRKILHLRETDPLLYHQYMDDKEITDGTKRLVHGLGTFPLSSKGRLNSGPLFAELSIGILRKTGRLGMVLPSGLATSSFTQYFFGHLVRTRRLVSFFEFENAGFFEGAGSGHMVRFALTTLSGRADHEESPSFLFHGSDLSELNDTNRVFCVTGEEIELLSPNTGTCPIFWSRADAELTKALYRRHAVLAEDNGGEERNPWKFEAALMFMSNTASDLLHQPDELSSDFTANMSRDGSCRVGDTTYLRFYQAKMVHQFNHRHGDFGMLEDGAKGHVLPRPPTDKLTDPSYHNDSKYWVDSAAVHERVGDRWRRRWFVGWRDVTDARASARTTISAIIPLSAVDSKFILAIVEPPVALYAAVLPAILNSYAFDYVARQKIGGTDLRAFIMKQLPVLSPYVLSRKCGWESRRVFEFLLPYVVELTYTAWDLESFATDCGYGGKPYRWDEERRELLRCELDAALFHLYLPASTRGEWIRGDRIGWNDPGETLDEVAELSSHFRTPRDAVAYILETFPVVRRKEEKLSGEFRTKRRILEIYDAMQAATCSGEAYETVVDPEPGHGDCRH